jgi:phosphohistidine phosphatase
MKLLTLMRHAKSSRDDPSLEDFDRPLADRGRREAPVMGAFLKERGLLPECVLCSSSRRTRETLALALPSLPASLTVSFSRRYYHAPPERILAELHATPDACAHMLWIGHNPGVNLLAQALADPRRSEEKSLARIEEGFKSGAVAHFELDIARWADVAPGKGALRLYAAPKDVMR